ncbi:MAG: hypothetical protein IJ767_00005, partial [Bacteroidaceae bacterium]|nr:hypothetical protein [Bacteroidaceae bacterium]
NPKESQKRERSQTSAVSTIYVLCPVIASSFPTTLIFVKIERSPIRNPDFSQSSKLPLYKEELLFFPKLRRISGSQRINADKSIETGAKRGSLTGGVSN